MLRKDIPKTKVQGSGCNAENLAAFKLRETKLAAF